MLISLISPKSRSSDNMITQLEPTVEFLPCFIVLYETCRSLSAAAASLHRPTMKNEAVIFPTIPAD